MTETVERPNPYFLSPADGMPDEYIVYARKLVSMSYQTQCGRHLHLLNAPAFREWADEEHRILGQEKARYTELAAMLAEQIVPGLGLDAEALRVEAESSISAGRKLLMVTRPFASWSDGLVFRHLFGLVLAGQLSAIIGSNYVPYANWAQETYFSFCLEKWPTPLGSPHKWRLARAIAEEGKETIQGYADKMWPRTIASFGTDGSANEAAYLRLGLKTRPNAMCRQLFLDLVNEEFAELGLRVPAA